MSHQSKNPCRAREIILKFKLMKRREKKLKLDLPNAKRKKNKKRKKCELGC